jgi:hypothetical protein
VPLGAGDGPLLDCYTACVGWATMKIHAELWVLLNIHASLKVITTTITTTTITVAIITT